MFSASQGVASAAEGAYIEDVFSTWLYTGNGGEQPVISNINLNNGADSSFTTNVGTLPVSIDVDFGGIAFGAGRYVAISGSFPTATAAYSTDGVNWTLTTLPTSQVWRDVSFCPGHGFVAIGTPATGPGTAFARSTDGITWTAITLSQSGNWRSITNNGSSTFVAVSGNGRNIIAYSTNGGVSWSFVASPNSGGLESVAYGNGRFVAIGTLSTTAAYSLDGITWTASTLPNQVSTVAHAAGRFIAVNGNGSNNTGATSVDGISWQALTLPVSAFWNCVSGISGNVCVSSTDTTLVSNDLINWENKSFGADRTVKNSTQLLFATWLGSLDSLSFPNTTGGLVWLKGRSGATDHALYDTARGLTFDLASSTTGAQTTQSTGLTGFLGNGFSIGALAKINTNAEIYTSWTFREQPRFFDIVTYTGNGANRTIAHNLGSAPGCIIIKRTDASTNWAVYHRGLAVTEALVLNSDAGLISGFSYWNLTAPTSSVFSLGTDSNVNFNGGTYVAYLFAHDAGGFGSAGTDSVVSCGLVNPSASFTSVNLGWEPQWVLIKAATSVGGWVTVDNMRGLGVSGTANSLLANSGAAEGTTSNIRINATGFEVTNALANTLVYVAIRRGPMRTPTSGASVFNPVVYTGTNVDNRLVGTSVAPDMVLVRQRNDTVLGGMVVGDRLRGQPYLLTGTTAVEVNDADAFDQQLVSAVEYGTAFSSMSGFWCGNDATAKLNANTTSNNHVVEAFRRAPGFFDVVCYTGTGVARTVSHNLGVAPELMLVKPRSATGGWQVYSAPTGSGSVMLLNGAGIPASDATVWNNTSPTSSVFGLGTSSLTNNNATNFVAYLFASCPGVSKIGTYSGTGATQTIDCGFAAGARFVLIKRTDSTGDWLIWDTARGIVAGNDPYLALNSTAAEVTTTDWVDTASTGFELSNAAANLANTNGASYIFLAIA